MWKTRHAPQEVNQPGVILKIAFGLVKPVNEKCKAMGCRSSLDEILQGLLKLYDGSLQQVSVIGEFACLRSSRETLG